MSQDEYVQRQLLLEQGYQLGRAEALEEAAQFMERELGLHSAFAAKVRALKARKP